MTDDTDNTNDFAGLAQRLFGKRDKTLWDDPRNENEDATTDDTLNN